MLANRSLPHDRRLAVMIGLVLMVATYLIFSIRAVIDPLTPGHFISLKRLIATAAGAGLFLLAVSKAARIPARGWAERITAMLWITAIGSLAMLAFRIGSMPFGMKAQPRATILRWSQTGWRKS